jgi:hypothetical protein
MPKLTRFQWQCATGPTAGERQAGNQADPELFGHHRVNRRHLLHHKKVFADFVILSTRCVESGQLLPNL